MRNRTDILSSVKVALSTKDSMQVVWSVFDDQSSIVRGFKIRYQAIGSNVVQYSGMLASSTSSHEITRLHENTAYDVCVHVFTADQQQPVYTGRDVFTPSAGLRLSTGCVAGSTGIDALRVAVGSTLGAFIALGVVVGFVLLAKCQHRQKLVGRRRGLETRRRRLAGDVIRRDGRCRLASTESDEVSLNDDDSFNTYDDEFRLPVGVEKKVEPTMLTFEGQKPVAVGRGEFLAETILADGADTWPSGCSSAVAGRSNDDASSNGTWPPPGRISVFPGARMQQFENRQKLLTPVTDRSPADSLASSSTSQYSQSAVQPDITVSVPPGIARESDGSLVTEGTPSCNTCRDDQDAVVAPSVERESTPNRLPPPPPVRVLLVSGMSSTYPAAPADQLDGISSCIFGSEHVSDRDRRPSTSLIMSPAGDQPLQPTGCTRSRQNSMTRDDKDGVGRMLTPDNSAGDVWSRLSKQQHLLPIPITKTTDSTQSPFGRSFPDLSVFGVMPPPVLTQHPQTHQQQQQQQQQQQLSNMSALSSALVTLYVPTVIRSIPAFNAYQGDLEYPPSSQGGHDDTVQLLSAEGTVDVRRGDNSDLNDQQWMQQLRPSPGTLRPNHSSIW